MRRSLFQVSLSLSLSPSLSLSLSIYLSIYLSLSRAHTHIHTHTHTYTHTHSPTCHSRPLECDTTSSGQASLLPAPCSPRRLARAAPHSRMHSPTHSLAARANAPLHPAHCSRRRVGEECLPVALGGQDEFRYEEALSLGLAFCSLDELSTGELRSA